MGALGAGAGLYESGKVRVHPTGGVTVYTGSHSHGQGHETTWSQIVADGLGVTPDREIIALIAYPFGRELCEARGRRDRRGPRGRLQRETQPRREAQAAENAEVVLTKALGRLAHGPDQAAGEVVPSAERVAPLAS